MQIVIVSALYLLDVVQNYLLKKNGYNCEGGQKYSVWFIYMWHRIIVPPVYRTYFRCKYCNFRYVGPVDSYTNKHE